MYERERLKCKTFTQFTRRLWTLVRKTTGNANCLGNPWESQKGLGIRPQDFCQKIPIEGIIFKGVLPEFTNLREDSPIFEPVGRIFWGNLSGQNLGAKAFGKTYNPIGDIAHYGGFWGGKRPLEANFKISGEIFGELRGFEALPGVGAPKKVVCPPTKEFVSISDAAPRIINIRREKSRWVLKHPVGNIWRGF